MKWLLIVFVANGWGGGDLKQVSAHETREACMAAGQAVYDAIKRVTQFTCIEGSQ